MGYSIWDTNIIIITLCNIILLIPGPLSLWPQQTSIDITSESIISYGVRSQLGSELSVLAPSQTFQERAPGCAIAILRRGGTKNLYRKNDELHLELHSNHLLIFNEICNTKIEAYFLLNQFGFTPTNFLTSSLERAKIRAICFLRDSGVPRYVSDLPKRCRVTYLDRSMSKFLITLPSAFIHSINFTLSQHIWVLIRLSRVHQY